jgi:GMP synthase-like glutamine amidotransferase
MRIHYLQHVPFEDAANIAVWARDQGHAVTSTRLCEAEPLPALDSFDWLVIMGGPMNIYQHDAHPWLGPEKKFIERAIEHQKLVLGICLGAQLVADVLGGEVTQNSHKEIGWFHVSLTDQGCRAPLLKGFPQRFQAFHWHGDTFSIPSGAERLAESEACANQAFQYAGRVLGLQFHLDYSVESIEKMLRHCGHELSDGPYVQSAETIRASYHCVPAIGRLLDQWLENLQGRHDGNGASPAGNDQPPVVRCPGSR